jgi:hypothetical protein
VNCRAKQLRILRFAILNDWIISATIRWALSAADGSCRAAQPSRRDRSSGQLCTELARSVYGGQGLSAIAVASIVFACVFGGALIGLLLRNLLPKEHLGTDTKDVVHLGIALVATMAALVLGLLIASAKSTYDTRRSQLLDISADVILLDRVLANYGPETTDARAMLQRSMRAALEQFWGSGRDRPLTLDPRSSSVEALYINLQQLSPQTEIQRSLQGQALAITLDMARTRVLLFEQLGRSIPVPFLVVLVFWLCIIFTSFALFAPKNATVVAAFFVCALSVSGALFLILELDQSFEGLMQVSSAPLRAALAQLGK